MPLRLGRLPEALREARELEMRAAAFLERHARFEKILRLAPQLGLRAKPAKRGEELRIAVAAGKPALGALDADTRFFRALGRRQFGRQLAVKSDQLGVPFGGERMLEDLAREARPAQGGGVAGGGGRDAGMQLVARRD